MPVEPELAQQQQLLAVVVVRRGLWELVSGGDAAVDLMCGRRKLLANLDANR